jgi:hypothetical protein
MENAQLVNLDGKLEREIEREDARTPFLLTVLCKIVLSLKAESRS